MTKWVLLSIFAVSVALADEKSEATERVHEATEVLREIMKVPDKSVPQDLLEQAHCVGIVPGVKKGGFIVGAQYGVGVACAGTVRAQDGQVHRQSASKEAALERKSVAAKSMSSFS